MGYSFAVMSQTVGDRTIMTRANVVRFERGGGLVFLVLTPVEGGFSNDRIRGDLEKTANDIASLETLGYHHYGLVSDRYVDVLRTPIDCGVTPDSESFNVMN